MALPAVVVDDLHKTYGDVHAVDGLSFAVEPGEVFALVGPNGAGKTTTVEILEGYRRRSGGEVSVLGFDPETGGRPFRERIGIVLQETGLDDEMSVRELVALYAGFFRRPRDVDATIDIVGLADKRTARIKTLSGGQKRRVDLALGLVGDPDLLFLDEPTTGFDPSARRKAWELVDSLKDLGKTILLTTHYMDEAEHLADRVAIIAAGRLVALGSPEQLAERNMAGLALITFRLPDGVGTAQLPPLSADVTERDQTVVVRSHDETRDLHLLTGWAIDHAVELGDLRLQRPTLEDVYLDVTANAVVTRGV